MEKRALSPKFIKDVVTKRIGKVMEQVSKNPSTISSIERRTINQIGNLPGPEKNYKLLAEYKAKALTRSKPQLKTINLNSLTKQINVN